MGNLAATKFGVPQADISLKESVDGLVAVVRSFSILHRHHLQTNWYRLMALQGRKRQATSLLTTERCLTGRCKAQEAVTTPISMLNQSLYLRDVLYKSGLFERDAKSTNLIHSVIIRRD